MNRNRVFITFGLSAFYLFYFALVGVYIIYLPKMLSIVGYSASEIGAIFSAAPMMRFIMPFIFRRFGGLNERTYKISLIATFISTLLLFVTLNNFVALFIINLIYGGAMGIILPFVDTYALNEIGKERYGKVRLWGSIGFMLIALWLGTHLQTPHQALIYLSMMALFTMLFGWKMSGEDSRSEATPKEGEFSLSKYWAFWIATFLMQVSFGGFYNFFTIYETANGISLELTSWLWSFGVICEIFMLYFQGPLLKFNLLKLIEISTFVTAIRWLLLWLYPDSLVVAFLSQSFHALSFALYYSATISYIYELYTQKRLAQQFFLGISFGLGGAIGSLIAGVVYDISPNELFLSQAIIALLAWIMVVVHAKRREYLK